MSEPRLAMSTDDDLPRTLRREREAREREAREREARAIPDSSSQLATAGYGTVDHDGGFGEPGHGVTVSRFDVPFLHMVRFCIKAVLAAIPALILLCAIIGGLMQLLKTFLPWLIQMQIFIKFT